MPKGKPIMIQGTASNAGKSLVAAGLCRVFRQDGYTTAPFKSQNMALNSYITQEGLEMGRAQVTQAQAAGISPSVLMNPVLLKPTGESRSQVIVNGEVWGILSAQDYYRRKEELHPVIQAAYDTLADQYQIVVLEGAGSPAEINLKSRDLVNMGMAAMADAPVLLVGDIDRGGVFASLYGTVQLLEPEERSRIGGLIINKFRGDPAILRPGLGQLEELCGIPVVGVVPWTQLELDDEDSVSDRLTVRSTHKLLDIAVVQLPRISNFTDFTALDQHPACGVRYVARLRQLGRPDLIILPGTKSTMADLRWLRQNGLEAAIKKLAEAGTPILGICGGYQMLGRYLWDPDGAEEVGRLEGMDLLPVSTTFTQEKERTRMTGKVEAITGVFSCISGVSFEGYEIHMGRTQREDAAPFATLDQGGHIAPKLDGAVLGNVAGTHVHGLLDSGELVSRLAAALLERKGLPAHRLETFDHHAHRERQFDLLAQVLRQSLDLSAIYRMMGVKL